MEPDLRDLWAWLVPAVMWLALWQADTTPPLRPAPAAPVSVLPPERAG